MLWISLTPSKWDWISVLSPIGTPLDLNYMTPGYKMIYWCPGKWSKINSIWCFSCVRHFVIVKPNVTTNNTWGWRFWNKSLFLEQIIRITYQVCFQSQGFNLLFIAGFFSSMNNASEIGGFRNIHPFSV